MDDFTVDYSVNIESSTFSDSDEEIQATIEVEETCRG